MHRILVPALLLALAGFAFAADASPVIKPIKSDVVRAAEARIIASKIPTIPTFAQPKSRDLSTLFPNWRPAKAGPSVEPTPSPAPVLTPEELAVDAVEILPERLHNPQVGVFADATVSTLSGSSLPIERAIYLEPSKHNYLRFFPVASWIAGRSLLVECRGNFKERLTVSFYRVSATTAETFHFGTLEIFSTQTDLRAFVVPPTPLDGFSHLVVDIKDTDYKGLRTSFERCTLTRL